MVWGGISKRGATEILIFQDIMNSDFYQRNILQAKLLPFIQATYPEGHRFQQDNDPKHTSRSTTQFMLDQNINWWKTPPESPDLNPIEKLWNELKNSVAGAQTRDELLNMIGLFWATVTPEKCQRYINHLPKAIEKVIENNGGPSGE